MASLCLLTFLWGFREKTRKHVKQIWIVICDIKDINRMIQAVLGNGIETSLHDAENCQSH